MSRSPRARALRQLRAWLADGTFVTGERLPAEADLTTRLGVSRKTVRVALAVLEQERLLENRGLFGRFAIAVPPAALLGSDAVALITRLDQELAPDRPRSGMLAIDSGLLAAAGQVGLTPMIVHQDGLVDSAAGEERIARLLAAPPRAVVLGSYADRLGAPAVAALVARFQAAGVPVVAFGDEPELHGCDRVASDHIAGCRELCLHLRACGARRILRLWQPGLPGTWLAGRDQGYEQAHAEAGLPPLAHLQPLPGAMSHTNPLEVRTRLMVGTLVDQLAREAGPVALLAISDCDVFPITRAVRLLGLEPGRDVLIAGYDNYWSDHPDHRATGERPFATVDKRNPELGARLARLVADRVAGRLPAGPQRVLLTPRLVP